MSSSAKAEAALALHRFGMGPRPGSIAAIESDPRGALIAELDRSPLAAVSAPAAMLPSSAKAFRAVADANAKRQAKAIVATKAQKEAASKMAEAPPMAEGTTPGMSAAAEKMAAEAIPDPGRGFYLQEAKLRIEAALSTEIGFVERLVWFWSNHFCISANKIQSMSGAYEREAIRPHVLGKFVDMLLAAEGHPAMLFYLDQAASMGVNSIAGINRTRGLNENLAREIMELHTLGVNGGYTQADVTSLARIITGWTFAGRDGKLAPPGTFVFFPNAHEPGPQKLLGKVYEDTGVAQGETALADIARHPATAKFIATKFVRHFIADDPPPALVTKLEATFKRTNGDLRAMTLALVDADEAWRAPMTKIRMPYEYLVASGRMMGRIPEDPQRYLGGLNVLGQPLWAPAGPNGFADTNAAWAAPENIKLRLDIASQISSRIADTIDPRALLDVVAGEAASTETRQTIERAESKQQAFALLLMSPEFQRR